MNKRFIAITGALLAVPLLGQAQGSYQVLAESLNPTYTGTSDSYSTSLSMVSLGGRTVSASYINDSGYTALGSVGTTIAEPVIDTDLTDIEAIAGETVEYVIEATVEGTAAYQWFKDTVAIEGATGSTLTLADVSGDDEGVYTVEVSNETGSVTSAGSTLSVIEVPVILEQPGDVVGNPGGDATLIVDARTEGDTTYEWSLNGTPIGDSNTDTLTLMGLDLDDEGSYTVTISNEAGSVTSDAASLVLVGGDTQVPGALVGSQVVSIGDGSVTYESPWFGEFTIEDDGDFGWVYTTPLGWTFMPSISTPEEAYILPLVIGDILYTEEGLYPTYAYWYAGESWVLFPETNDISTGSIWVWVYTTEEWVEYEDIQ